MLKLIRYNSNVLYTGGVLFIGETYIGDSLELPWRGNQHNISCIPEGTYDIEFGIMKDGLSGYRLLEVEGRDGIWIHPANYVSELEGCIAPGIKYGDTVRNSTKTLKVIYAKLGRTSELLVTKERGFK